ncbi:MAG TPA: PAS domain S-box protein [Cellvibrionaceae bacterium]
MFRAAKPSRTVWFWAFIAGVFTLASSVALLWNHYRQQRAQFIQTHSSLPALTAQQFSIYDALLTQVASASTGSPLPPGVIEVSAQVDTTGLVWQVVAGNLPLPSEINTPNPHAKTITGMKLTDWIDALPKKPTQDFADVFAAKGSIPGLFISRRGCEEASCRRWWLAFVPLATLPSALEPGWQVLREETKSLQPIWPLQANTLLDKERVQFFTWREQRWVLYVRGPSWPWLASAVALMLSLCLAALTAALAWLRELASVRAREQARTRALAEASDEAVLTIRPDGKVASWSRGAILLWEYGPREVLGRPVTQLFDTQLAAALQPLAKGKAVRGTQLKAKNARGDVFHVQLNAVPILNHAKQVVGAALSVIDLRSERSAQTRLLAQEKILAHTMSLLEKNNSRCVNLEQARRHLQTVLDAVPFVIGYWDKHQINQVANRAHRARFGVDAAEIPGMSLQELLTPTDYEEQFGRVQAALAGMPQTYEYTQVNEETGAFSHYLGQYLPDTSKTGVRGFYVIEQDITELVEGNLRLGRALEENDVLLTTINNQLLYSVTDAEGVIQDVNDNYCAALGYERSELLGQTHRLINSGVHNEEFWSGLWTSLMAGNPWRAELCNRTKDGQERWFDTVIAPFHGQAGKVEKCVALSIDITSRKAVEQEHQRLGQLLRDVLEAASEVAIIATDTQGAITLFNTGAESMLGYSADEMLGEFPLERFHVPEEITAFELQASNPTGLTGFGLLSTQALENGPQTQQWTYVRKNASQLKVSVTLSAMRGQDGILVGYLIVAADITDSLKQQQALISAKDQLLAAAEVAELGVWEFLPAQQQLHWNERMFEIFGQPLDQQPEGIDDWFANVHTEDQEQIAERFASALQGLVDFAGVYRFITRDGTQRYIQFGAYFERDLAGEVFKITGISRDITGQQELENQLRQAKEQADAANLAKSQFLANMSHEIRTPMNAVLGMLQLVGHTSLSLRQQDYVNKAQTAAKSLLGLLNDILDFSKIDAGKLVIDPTCCSLDDICADVAVVMAGNQGDKPVEVIFDLDPQLPQAVLIDKLRVQQILINLIGNALKFTAQGQVWIQLLREDIDPLSLAPQNSGHALIRFYIRDTGIGIREDQHQRIFDGFVQAEASTTRRFGGTGLGLVITKNLIELMGGQLSLQSELGVGSEFSFELNLPLADAPSLAPKAHLPAGGSVLLVHETPLAISVLERDLTRLGFEVTSAHSATDALSLGEGRARAGEAFTLALVDWRLNESNGFALAEQLHSISLQPLAVILLLTQRQKEQLALYQGQDANFLWQLSKPIVRPALEQVLGLVLAGDPAQPHVQETSHILAGVSLLVVEDNALNRQVAAELLGGLGAKISLAVDGRDGVNKATARGADYDLILMDLQMPTMDGLEATRQLRHLGLKLPILAMTANASAEDKDECLAAGMDGHLSKPIDLNLVVAAIRHALGLASASAKIEPATAAEIEDESGSEAEEEFSTLTDVDLLLTDADIAELSALGGFDDDELAAAQIQDEQVQTDELLSNAEMSTELLGDDSALEQKAERLDVEQLGQPPAVEEMEAKEETPEVEAVAPNPFAAEHSKLDESEPLNVTSEETNAAKLPTETIAADVPAPPSEAVVSAPLPADDGEWIDGLDEILRRFGGKRVLFQKMLANLAPETQRLLDELKSAAADNDRNRAITAVHSIKGTAATLGAKALSSRAAWLEKRLKITELPIEQSLTPHAYAALEEALAAALVALGQALAA